MNGTILDFLRIVAEKPDLTKEFVELAARHDFEFTDEVSDEDLDKVVGGVVRQPSGFTATAPQTLLPSDSSTNTSDGNLSDCYLLSQLAQLGFGPGS